MAGAQCLGIAFAPKGHWRARLMVGGIRVLLGAHADKAQAARM